MNNFRVNPSVSLSRLNIKEKRPSQKRDIEPTKFFNSKLSAFSHVTKPLPENELNSLQRICENGILSRFVQKISSSTGLSAAAIILAASKLLPTEAHHLNVTLGQASFAPAQCNPFDKNFCREGFVWNSETLYETVQFVMRALSLDESCMSDEHITEMITMVAHKVTAYNMTDRNAGCNQVGYLTTDTKSGPAIFVTAAYFYQDFCKEIISSCTEHIKSFCLTNDSSDSLDGGQIAAIVIVALIVSLLIGSGIYYRKNIYAFVQERCSRYNTIKAPLNTQSQTSNNGSAEL